MMDLWPFWDPEVLGFVAKTLVDRRRQKSIELLVELEQQFLGRARDIVRNIKKPCIGSVSETTCAYIL